MTGLGFREFFRQATGGKDPFPYQACLADGADLPVLLEAPTGAGKTLAVLLAWLWRRRFHPDPDVRAATPRRLVYCLPMRVLVEQTTDVARECLRRPGVLDEATREQVRVAVLMGGEDAGDWDVDPVGDSVLIGTQDMLLSRALNRGFGMSRFRWPAHFGLLNNDCLWVLDEVQLTGNGLATSVQLDAFRRQLGVYGPQHTLWMSATIASEWLQTVDSMVSAESPILRLGTADRSDPRLARRLNAQKSIQRLPVVPSGSKPYAASGFAQAVLEKHVDGSLTLVVFNTVRRAQEVAQATARLLRKARDAPDVLLLHSRFRSNDRRERLTRLTSALPPRGRIVLATQVIEAGVDLSARTLITEVAPWASLVQRFGRCNRFGEHAAAQVFWVDLNPEKHSAPYAPSELEESRAILRDPDRLSVAPALLPPVTTGPEASHVLRRHDLIDLFDTTPDLAGADVDVSRFVRGSDQLDVQVFWQSWDRHASPNSPATAPAPLPSELCPVPVGEMRDFLTAKPAGVVAWTWDHLDRRWRQLASQALRPGLILLLHADDGGYTPTDGWIGRAAKGSVPIQGQKGRAPEGTDDDERTHGDWQTLASHGDDVVAAVGRISARLDGSVLPRELVSVLTEAARWHDRGKGHPIFQETLLRAARDPAEQERRQGTLWAKTPVLAGRHRRKHFRHELASALAVLQRPLDDNEAPRQDLVAYLVAAHHGKVRLAIRSLPDEQPPRLDVRIALGIVDDDPLPVADLGGGVVAPALTLNLSVSELGLDDRGERSWTDRMTGWLDRLGPFRLAFLEALIVAADVEASRAARAEG